MVATVTIVRAMQLHVTPGPGTGTHSGHLRGRSESGSSQYTDAQARYTAGASQMLVALASGEHRAGPRTWVWNLRPQPGKAQGLSSHPWSHWGPIGEGLRSRSWPTFPASVVQEDAAPSRSLHLIYLDN